MKRIRLLSLLLSLFLLTAVILTGCKKDSSESEKAANSIDYMVLVNKTHQLPEDWETKLETVHMTNSIGDDVEVEKKAYDAYLKLKEALEKENVFVDLDSARRSVADQQRIMDDFTKQYGADYAAKTVAKPGFSEHHTGLALDLYLIIDGKDVTENEDMVQYPEIWAKIHAKLSDYGFILRYLDGAEHITGYSYEPWHIRYLDDIDTAKEITSEGITLEEYLGTASSTKVSIDYGTSEIFTEDELKDAVIKIKCQFAFWDGCELYNIRYAGDDAVTDEHVQQLSNLDPDSSRTNLAKFLMDFRSEKGNTTFSPNSKYTDYNWWMLLTEKDGWKIIDQGFDG